MYKKIYLMLICQAMFVSALVSANGLTYAFEHTYSKQQNRKAVNNRHKPSEYGGDLEAIVQGQIGNVKYLLTDSDIAGDGYDEAPEFTQRRIHLYADGAYMVLMRRAANGTNMTDRMRGDYTVEYVLQVSHDNHAYQQFMQHNTKLLTSRERKPSFKEFVLDKHHSFRDKLTGKTQNMSVLFDLIRDANKKLPWQVKGEFAEHLQAWIRDYLVDERFEYVFSSATKSELQAIAQADSHFTSNVKSIRYYDDLAKWLPYPTYNSPLDIDSNKRGFDASFSFVAMPGDKQAYITGNLAQSFFVVDYLTNKRKTEFIGVNDGAAGMYLHLFIPNSHMKSIYQWRDGVYVRIYKGVDGVTLSLFENARPEQALVSTKYSFVTYDDMYEAEAYLTGNQLMDTSAVDAMMDTVEQITRGEHDNAHLQAFFDTLKTILENVVQNSLYVTGNESCIESVHSALVVDTASE